MIVLKFGGTSIQDESGILRMTGIVRNSIQKHPILIFSAMGKTTRNLLALGKHCVGGVCGQSEDLFQELVDYHRTVANRMMNDPSGMDEALQPWFEGIRECMDRIMQMGTLPLVDQDRLLAHGELMASTIMSAVLRSMKVDACWLDARELVVTNERFSRAMPLMRDTEIAVREKILPVIQQGKIPVTQGYIGATRNGDTTTLGFEGSDYTAAILGAALRVDEIQIWKDVPGILTADPMIVDGVFTVPQLSFEEAAVLTSCGAKVLHPGTIHPAKEKGVPVCIYSTRQPDGLHTVIVNKGEPSVKSIAYKTGLRLILIKPSGSGAGWLDRARSLFGSDCEPRLWIHEKEELRVVVEDALLPKDWENSLEGFVHVESIPHVATVSVVGENLRNKENKRTFFQNLMQGIPLLSDTDNLPLAWTAVVEEKDVQRAVKALHKRLFSKRKQ